MMAGEKWYQGTADSIRQNLYLIEDESPEHVLILSGDHVYKMDYARFGSYHETNKADVTIAVIEQGKEMAGQYGIVEVDKRFRVKGFQEKPKNPKTIPGDSAHVLASMGIYIFKTQVLLDLLQRDDRPDFGKDLLPDILKTHRVMAYPYRRENKIPDIIAYTDTKGIRREKWLTASATRPIGVMWGPWIHTGMPTWT